MPVTITVTQIRPNTTQTARRIIRNVNDNIVGALPLLTNRVVTFMQNVITKHKRREGSVNRLENALKASTFITLAPRSIFIGIGHIPTLKVLAPYWRILNYGGSLPSTHPGVVPGTFEGLSPLSQLKGTGVGRQRFTYMPKDSRSPGDQFFFMKVTSPIAPVHYIERTMSWLLGAVPQVAAQAAAAAKFRSLFPTNR